MQSLVGPTLYPKTKPNHSPVPSLSTPPSLHYSLFFFFAQKKNSNRKENPTPSVLSPSRILCPEEEASRNDVEFDFLDHLFTHQLWPPRYRLLRCIYYLPLLSFQINRNSTFIPCLPNTQHYRVSKFLNLRFFLFSFFANSFSLFGF